MKSRVSDASSSTSSNARRASRLSLRRADSKNSSMCSLPFSSAARPLSRHSWHWSRQRKHDGAVPRWCGPPHYSDPMARFGSAAEELAPRNRTRHAPTSNRRNLDQRTTISCSVRPSIRKTSRAVGFRSRYARKSDGSVTQHPQHGCRYGRSDTHAEQHEHMQPMVRTAQKVADAPTRTGPSSRCARRIPRQ